LARVHLRTRNLRSNYLHQLTSALVDYYDGFCLETLSLKGMARTKLARSVADAALGELSRRLRYKADFGHAPQELVALIVAMGAGLASSLLVTLVRKISIHVAVVAGAVVILVLVFGTTWLALVPLIAAIGWARVSLGDHTPAESIAGALFGAAVAATVFSALR
jgi:hypothetical protein